eukprot:scpid66392/ scgid3010/ Transmembrane protein 199
MSKFGGLRASVTPHMIEVLTDALDSCDLPDSVKAGSEFGDGHVIEVAHLRQLCQSANAAKPGSLSLHNLMKGSELSMAPLPQRERNPELVARLERIKANLAHKEYDQLVGNVSRKEDREPSLGQQYRQVTIQTTVILNSFITVIGSFFFAFFACRYIGLDLVAQVSAGLFVGTLVFFADLYFIMRDEFGKERGVPESTKRSLSGPRTMPSAKQEVETISARKR